MSYEIERPSDELQAEVIELSEYRAQKYLTQERKDEISRRISHIVFELRARRGDFDPDDAA